MSDEPWKFFAYTLESFSFKEMQLKMLPAFFNV